MTVLTFTDTDERDLWLPLTSLAFWATTRDGSGLVVTTITGHAFPVKDALAFLEQIAPHVSQPQD